MFNSMLSLFMVVHPLHVARLRATAIDAASRARHARADMLVGTQQIKGPGPRIEAMRDDAFHVLDDGHARRRLHRRCRAARRSASAPEPACRPTFGKPPRHSASKSSPRPQKYTPVNALPPVWLRNHASLPSTCTGASVHAAPGTIVQVNASAASSGVFSGESRSTAGTDRRPLLTMRRANGQSLRELEHRVAEHARHRALRRDEIGGARRVAGCFRRRRIRARTHRCRAARAAHRH